MSIDLTVDGSPASCRAAAREVRALADRVGAAGDLLAECNARASSDWTGDASDGFTHVVKRRIFRADEVHEELLVLALGLEGLAEGLAKVKSEMGRARGVAAGAGIHVSTFLPEPGEIIVEPGQEGPLDHAVGIATRARELEQQWQSAWRQCLDRVTGIVWDPVVVDPTSPEAVMERANEMISGWSLGGDGDGDGGGLHLPDVKGVLQSTIKSLPSLPDIGDQKIPTPALLLPGAVVPLMTLKQAKRAFPKHTDAINDGIREAARSGVPAGAAAACSPLSPAGSALCSAAANSAARPIGDEIVEMTDAK